MKSIQNDHVTQEVEKMLAPLKEANPAQYDIITRLINDVYSDPKIEQPEALTRAIEDKLYRLIDDHVRFTLKQQEDDH